MSSCQSTCIVLRAKPVTHEVKKVPVWTERRRSDMKQVVMQRVQEAWTTRATQRAVRIQEEEPGCSMQCGRPRHFRANDRGYKTVS